MRLIYFFLSVPVVFVSSIVSAQEAPLGVISLGHTVENSYLDAECNKLGNGNIKCDFVQTAIRKNTKPEDWKKELAKVDLFIQDIRKKGEKDCTFAKKLLGIVTTGIVPEKTEGFSDTSKLKEMLEGDSEEKRDMLKMAPLMEASACNPTPENATKLLRHIFDKNLKTCNISIHKFSQTFEKQSAGRWVHSSKPTGNCGAIHIGTMEYEDGKILSGWKYTTQKVITNKGGKHLLLNCSDLDENEYVYSYENVYDTKNLGCEYIKYGFF